MKVGSRLRRALHKHRFGIQLPKVTGTGDNSNVSVAGESVVACSSKTRSVRGRAFHRCSVVISALSSLPHKGERAVFPWREY